MKERSVDDNEGDGAALAEALAPFYSEERTCFALGISQSNLAARRERGQLLGVRTSDGDYFYPVAQFETADSVVRVRSALRAFFEALARYDSWAVGLVMVAPADKLDGLTPIEWVREKRDPEALAEYARILAAEWSR